MIGGVFFDGDETLWDFQKLMRKALAQTLNHLRQIRPGANTESLTVEDLIADRAAAEADPATAGMTLEELRLAAFTRTVARVGSPDSELAANLNAFYLERRFTDVTLFEDVLPVLSELRTRLPLGLLSNGNGYPERSGLTGMFSVVVFSDEYGATKPDKRLFDIAATRVNLPPERLVMVGDSLINDVAGAQAAGWRGFWLNRDRQRHPSRVHPDAELESLHDLPAALAPASSASLDRADIGACPVISDRFICARADWTGRRA